MFNIGPTELIVILLIALIVFGPKRLPEVGKTLGRSLQEFRRASNDLREELQRGINEEPSARDPAPPRTPDTTKPVAKPARPPEKPPTNAARRNSARTMPSIARSHAKGEQRLDGEVHL